MPARGIAVQFPLDRRGQDVQADQVGDGHHASPTKDQPHVFINPSVQALGGAQEQDEGCLSVPGFYETVRRAERIRVTALDLQGRPFALDADGMLAVCIQRERDHLDGKLFVDYLSSLKRNRIRKRLDRRRRAGAAAR